MKDISTLISDIHAIVGKAEGLTASPQFLEAVSSSYSKQLNVREEKERPEKTIYFSEIGDQCERRLWYRANGAADVEPINPASRVKFMYGDVLEGLVLQLCRDAGHTVECEQEVVEYVDSATGWRVRGKLDAVIDKVVVDVKSVTSMSEQKFWKGLEDDPFGYYGQLNGYTVVRRSDQMGFLTIQKEMGHIRWFPFTPDGSVFGYGFARAVNAMGASAPPPVAPQFSPVPASPTSPNKKLCTACSYCQYKKNCFPSVRGFKYSNKVEWLTEVRREPAVPEIGTDGGLET